jgi:predicted  nucleic acid-binding Zn-ribbon protein
MEFPQMTKRTNEPIDFIQRVHQERTSFHDHIVELELEREELLQEILELELELEEERERETS